MIEELDHQRRAWLAIGLVVGLLTVGAVAALGSEDRVAHGAIVLGFIAAIYVGFAIAEGDPAAILTEAVVALLALAICALAIELESIELVAAGVLGHAFWDLAHHPSHRPASLAEVRRWYPPVCLVTDLTIAVGFGVMA